MDSLGARSRCRIGDVSDKLEVLDTLGLLCPLPIIKTAQRMKTVEIGAELVVLSDDAGIVEDMPAWCKSSGNELVSLVREGRVYRSTVRRLK